MQMADYISENFLTDIYIFTSGLMLEYPFSIFDFRVNFFEDGFVIRLELFLHIHTYIHTYRIYNDYHHTFDYGHAIKPFYNNLIARVRQQNVIYTGWNDKIVILKKTTQQLHFKTFIEKINSGNLIM